MQDEALAARLERIAEWQVGLRPGDRADLRRAAEIVRSGPPDPVTVVAAPKSARS